MPPLFLAIFVIKSCTTICTSSSKSKENIFAIGCTFFLNYGVVALKYEMSNADHPRIFDNNLTSTHSSQDYDQPVESLATPLDLSGPAGQCTAPRRVHRASFSVNSPACIHI